MLRDYLISNYKEDVESAMATAEDAIKQRFIFNQRWDMERTYVAETFDGEINFMHQPGGDPEWVYAFNRLKHEEHSHSKKSFITPIPDRDQDQTNQSI